MFSGSRSPSLRGALKYTDLQEFLPNKGIIRFQLAAGPYGGGWEAADNGFLEVVQSYSTIVVRRDQVDGGDSCVD